MRSAPSLAATSSAGSSCSAATTMCAAASVNTATYSSADGTTVPRHAVGMPPEDTDPPEHRKYRDILNPPFAPAAIAAAEPWMRDIAVSLFDAVAGNDHIEFVSAVAAPLPRQIILRMLGAPNDDLERLNEPMEVLTVPTTMPSVPAPPEQRCTHTSPTRSQHTEPDLKATT